MANEAVVLNKIEQALVMNDLSKLSDLERISYYNNFCKSLGLNPLTQPLAYITLNNKLTLYAKRDCADQLRKIHGVSVEIKETKQVGDVYVVTVKAKDKTGREDEATGVVTIGHLKGDALANALMKCETKAKRRVTLSICGLGLLDETELETIPSNELSDAATNVPQISSVKNEVHEPHEIENGNESEPPTCPTCGEQMLISKTGKHWYCRNWQKKENGEHPTIKREV